MSNNESELEELFHLASQEPKEERRAFLEARCDDATLREQVLRLLAQDDAGTRTLLREGARPAVGYAGDTIDRYTIVKKLGEGGMGTVYLAHQEEPVKRDVALKTIREGAHTEEVARRFEAEKQALALMSHPGIAKVFDGGRTKEGLPYFVMEYCPGESLSQYTARHRLEKDRFLELFREICGAVHHAHQKGIIHRDLKPGNVLIVEREGQAHPKVIDFGIARSLTGSLTGDDGLTRGQVMGTFKYMSPEQAEPRKGVDTRADIYALGVMLYEWLAGEPPFSMAELEERTPGEAWRILLEEEPPPPSRRFAALPSDRRGAVAMHRRSDARSWEHALKGDLDWIVMKALSKDRAERYASASELRADIARHLADLPVHAGPPGGFYRARKFLRRHRVGVGAGLAVAAALVVALGLSRRSEALAEKAHAEAERELAEALYQAEKAEAFLDYFDDALSHGESDRHLTLVERLGRSSERAGVLFRGRPEAEGAVRFTLGESYLLLGADLKAFEELLQARRLQESALDSEPEHFDIMRTLMRLVEAARRLEREEEVRRYVQESLDKSRRILEASPDIGDELAWLFRAAAGEKQDGERELEALRVVCAAVPEERNARSKALLRLVVEAVLNGSTGRAGADALRTVFASRVRPGSARGLVFDWELAQLYLQPDFLDFEEALELAVRVQGGAATTYSSDHWLALDALRLRGLALAERWKHTREPRDLAAAEDYVHTARERVLRLQLEPNYRQMKTSQAYETLWSQLRDDDTRREWLEASWMLWSARPTGSSEGFWPCLRPGLPDGAYELALEVLPEGRGDPRVREQRAYALTRRKLYDQALSAFEGLTSPSPLTILFHVLCLAELGRLEEARALRRGLEGDLSQRGEAAVLQADLDKIFGKG